MERKFTALYPNQLWVADITYLATWRGVVYTTLVIDVFARRIVGWRVWNSLRTDLVEVEYATLEWVDWFNNKRLLEPIGNIPPAELEQAYYEQLESQPRAA